MNALRTRITRSWQSYVDAADRREAVRMRTLPGLRTRAHRRRFTLLVLFGNLLMLAGAAITSEARVAAFLVLWFTGFAIWIVSWTLLRVLTGKVTSAFSTLLDERERELRHRANYVGFQVTATLMLVATFYPLFLTHQPDAGTRAGTMTGALLILGATTPTAILGWTLPDDDPADLHEEEPDA